MLVYAKLTVDTGDFKCEVKLVAESLEVFDAYKCELEDEFHYTIIDEFIDTEYGTLVILPEDFKY